VPADFWLARDAQYQAFKARSESYSDLEAQAEWLQELPLNEMIRFVIYRKGIGWDAWINILARRRDA
jgi:hypothetical protein